MKQIATIVLSGAVAIGIAAPASALPVAVHDYELNGSLADSVVGGPPLVSDGGTLGASTYTFGVGQGLNLSGAINNPTGPFSIEINFAFDDLSGWRRILDFKNGTSDNGLYDLGTALNFFNVTTGPTAAFTPGVFSDLLLTRSGSGIVTGYVDGVQQITFDDSLANDATFSGLNAIARFFEDDSVVPGENSSGSVDRIRIFDTELTAADAADLAAVPEPASIALLGAALAGFGLIRRRRKSG